MNDRLGSYEQLRSFIFQFLNNFNTPKDRSYHLSDRFQQMAGFDWISLEDNQLAG